MGTNDQIPLKQFTADTEIEAPTVLVQARDLTYCSNECEFDDECPLKTPGKTFRGTLHIYKGDYDHVVSSMPEETRCVAHDNFMGVYASTIGNSYELERRWLEIEHGGMPHVVPFSKFELISDLNVLKYDLIDGHVFRPIGTTPELPGKPEVKRVSQKEFLNNLSNLMEK